MNKSEFVKKGDAIITGVNGEKYPRRRDIFDEISETIEKGEDRKSVERMNKSEFVKKWEHMFKLIEDKGLFLGNAPEDLPILMLRDALDVILSEKDVVK